MTIEHRACSCNRMPRRWSRRRITFRRIWIIARIPLVMEGFCWAARDTMRNYSAASSSSSNRLPSVKLRVPWNLNHERVAWTHAMSWVKIPGNRHSSKEDIAFTTRGWGTKRLHSCSTKDVKATDMISGHHGKRFRMLSTFTKMYARATLMILGLVSWDCHHPS